MMRSITNPSFSACLTDEPLREIELIVVFEFDVEIGTLFVYLLRRQGQDNRGAEPSARCKMNISRTYQQKES